MSRSLRQKVDVVRGPRQQHTANWVPVRILLSIGVCVFATMAEKVLILGKHASGKTTLAEHLRKNDTGPLEVSECHNVPYLPTRQMSEFERIFIFRDQDVPTVYAHIPHHFKIPWTSFADKMKGLDRYECVVLDARHPGEIVTFKVPRPATVAEDLVTLRQYVHRKLTQRVDSVVDAVTSILSYRWQAKEKGVPFNDIDSVLGPRFKDALKLAPDMYDS